MSNRIPHDKALIQWGILAGDFVHQLRAALDNSVYLLTRRNDASVPDRQGSPWHDGPEIPELVPRGYLMATLDILYRATMNVLEALQPFLPPAQSGPGA